MSKEVYICMYENNGHKASEPPLDMQSKETLMHFIRTGYRTAECWAELTTRNKRLEAYRKSMSRRTAEKTS